MEWLFAQMSGVPIFSTAISESTDSSWAVILINGMWEIWHTKAGHESPRMLWKAPRVETCMAWVEASAL